MTNCGYDKIENMSVKLILRDKEYEVKPGMMLLDALKKSKIVPESVIATLPEMRTAHLRA